MIQSVTSYTVDDAMIGGLLAIFLIFLFLRNWRPTLIIGLAIPLSIITTFIAFYLAGYTLNLLTLGGLALGIGRMVDDSIVVIENTFRHIELGESRKEAAIRGASEVGMAVTASTLTTIVVFFPMVVASGITAKLTRGLAVAIVFSLVSSLFVSLTIVPMLSSFLLRAKEETAGGRKKVSGGGFEKARAFYRGLLAKALLRRRWVLGGAFAAFRRGPGHRSHPGYGVHARLRRGHDLPQGQDAGRDVPGRDQPRPGDGREDRPEAAGSEADHRPGRAWRPRMPPAQSMSGGFSTTGSHEGLLWIGLTPKDKRKAVRPPGAGPHPGLAAGHGGRQVRGPGRAPGSSWAASRSRSPSRSSARTWPSSRRSATTSSPGSTDVPGLRDLTHTLAKGKPEYRIHIDREKAGQAGLSVYQVANMVQTATQGKVVSRYREGGEEIDLRVRFREEFRDTMEDIRTIPILNAVGKTVYLGQVAAVETGRGPDLDRPGEPDPHGRRSRPTSPAATWAASSRTSRPGSPPWSAGFRPATSSSIGGAYQQMNEAFLVLAGVFALAVLLIYMVMASQFESFKHPFVIMFTIPLSLIGVIVLLLLITAERST